MGQDGMSTKIIIQCVAAAEQRLDVYRDLYCGDWFVDPNGDIRINVTGEDVWDDEEAFLIALHELIEARLCFKAGITQSLVDSFDVNWHGPPDTEPGDDADAPYQSQHRSAMLIEFLMAKFMGIDGYGTMK